jgi:hypothetical protein
MPCKFITNPEVAETEKIQIQVPMRLKIPMKVNRHIKRVLLWKRHTTHQLSKKLFWNHNKDAPPPKKN